MPIWDAALPFMHDMYSCFPWARCIAGEVAHMAVPTVLLDTQRTTLGITSKCPKTPKLLGYPCMGQLDQINCLMFLVVTPTAT